MSLSKKIPVQIPAQIPGHSHGHLPRGKFIRYTVWLIHRALYKSYSCEECGMNCQKPWVNTASIAKPKALEVLSVGFRIRMRKAQGKHFAYRRVSGLFPPPLSRALSGVSTVAFWFLSSPKDGFMVVCQWEERRLKKTSGIWGVLTVILLVPGLWGCSEQVVVSISLAFTKETEIWVKS